MQTVSCLKLVMMFTKRENFKIISILRTWIPGSIDFLREVATLTNS
uniref:Uncharacterized protein n=1 Tax=Ciona intestinalis TaxID=7719 RepID=F6XRE9_CIOIN